MPLYEYECPMCGYKSLEVMKMGLAADAPKVPCRGLAYGQCGYPMVRQISLPHTDMKAFHTPVEMHSIGCTSVDQIREMQQAGITVSDNPADPLYGTPIAHTRKEKLRALKVAGFAEGK